MWAELEHEATNDSYLQQLRQNVQDNDEAFSGYSCIGKLFFNEKLVIPHTSLHIPALFQEFHDSPVGGHSGFLWTFKRVAVVVYWKGMRSTIKQYVAACARCEQCKYDSVPWGVATAATHSSAGLE